MSKEVDVIIVGGGLSGLSAALLLQKQGLRIQVLEARDRVGGRTYTLHSDQTGAVDLGAAYIGPTQKRVLRLVRECGAQSYLTHEVEDALKYKQGQSVRYRDAIFPPTESFLGWLDFNNLIRRIDTMCKQVPIEAPWKAQHAELWDKMTVQQFLDKTLWTRSAMETATHVVNVNLTSEPYEVSLLWFLWYLASAGGPLRIHSTSNGGQERKLVGGTQQLSEYLLQRLGQGNVLLNRAVCTIEQNETHVIATDILGNPHKGSYCIVALAPPLQSRIRWIPSLPGTRYQLLQRLPMGSVIKTFMYYNTPFWRYKGLCGTACILDKDDDALIGITVDHVQHDGSFPALMGFVLSDTVRKKSSMTREERKDRISRLYAQIFGTEQALSPVHYEEKNWCDDEWSGGCYTVMMPPGFLTTFGPHLRQAVDRVHFAGTETASEWSGYMEGAIQAGERAAREILQRKGLITAQDVWQDEPEDPEIRGFPLELSTVEKLAPSVPVFLAGTFFVIAVTISAVTVCRYRF